MAVASGNGIAVSAQVEFAGAVLALERFERQGVRALDRAMHKVADETAAGAKGRGGDRYGEIVVRGSNAEYVVVAMQQDGRHIANYHQHGTLASRKPAARRPGTKRDHSKPGIRRKRFLRKPPKRTIIERVLEAVIEAGDVAGLEMRRGL